MRNCAHYIRHQAAQPTSTYFCLWPCLFFQWRTLGAFTKLKKARIITSIKFHFVVYKNILA